jgi:putative ABC transport system substrate-binding protein
MFPSHRWCKSSILGLALLSLVLALPAAHAQSTGKTIRVGTLMSGSALQWAFLENALVAGLRDHGYVEGRNLVVVRRYGELNGDRIKSAAAELAAMKLDAIVTSCTTTTRLTIAAAPTTPIVIASVTDPVGQGLVRSYARPGGNVTGRSTQFSDFEPKRLQLLRSVLPDGARVAVLMNGRSSVHESDWRSAEAAARSLGMEPIRIEVRGAAGLEPALENLAKAGVHGLLVLSDDPMVVEFRDRIVAAAVRLRLPSISGFRAFVDDGGLMHYGPDQADAFRASAAYVVKLAHGANPAELPIEQPTQFELVLNLRTAAALGITIPRELRLRADRTIE